jgi:hypothetical protein
MPNFTTVLPVSSDTVKSRWAADEAVFLKNVHTVKINIKNL